MNRLAKQIKAVSVPHGGVALWWLAQAGFVFKTAGGKVLYVDPYLSNVVEKAFGFKRLSPAPIEAEDVRADWVVNSHEHLDHLDTDALPVIAEKNPGCRFAGSASCETEYGKCGIAPERTLIVQPDGKYELDDATLYTARADHGELSPSALSLLFDFKPVRVLFTGDTALRLDWLRPLIDRKPDVLLPCINGKFGNLDASEAAHLTALVSPKAAIPCHFWMFKEHNGDPESFIRACTEKCPHVAVQLLTPGEGLLVTRDRLSAL